MDISVLDDEQRAAMVADIRTRLPDDVVNADRLAAAIVRDAELRTLTRVMARNVGAGRPWLVAALDQAFAGDFARTRTQIQLSGIRLRRKARGDGQIPTGTSGRERPGLPGKE